MPEARISRVFRDAVTGTAMVLTGIEEQPGAVLCFGPDTFGACSRWINENPAPVPAGFEAFLRGAKMSPGGGAEGEDSNSVSVPAVAVHGEWTLWKHLPTSICFLLPAANVVGNQCEALMTDKFLHTCLRRLRQEDFDAWQTGIKGLL